MPPTFGRRKPAADPVWEREFAAHLKESYGSAELIDLFYRFGSGESPLEMLMRRTLLRALSKQVGNDVQVAAGVVLRHPETMEFGDCVFIGAQTVIQGRFDGSCKIGSHVWIGPQSFFDARELILEDYVGWGPGAKVLGSTHTGTPLTEPLITTALSIRPVRVGLGADIGMNATILPGVRIGANAIIGAGAVVTGDIPDFAIAAGVPARVLRDRRHGRSGAEETGFFVEGG